MKSKSIKPIKPKDSNTSSYRQKLQKLIKRMQRDYELQLKPLIKKMNKEQREQLSETKDITKLITTDAEKFFTAYEVSRMLNTVKSRIISDIQSGKLKGAFRKDDKWLIPEENINEYAKLIGKAPIKDTLLEKFNKRLQRLRDKYEDLLYLYQDMAEKEVEKNYKQARAQFKKNFEKATGIDITSAMTDRGLKQAFEAEVESNVGLIKSLPEKYFGTIQQMVSQNMTGQKKFEGGLIVALQDLTGTTKKKAKLIARDQTSKAVSTFSSLRSQNAGSIGYKWHNSQDKRVAGNPNGLYPKVDPKSKYHGNHWDREDKYYLWNKTSGKIPIAPDGKKFKQPLPDGSPGMAIACRCFAEPVFLED